MKNRRGQSHRSTPLEPGGGREVLALYDADWTVEGGDSASLSYLRRVRRC